MRQLEVVDKQYEIARLDSIAASFDRDLDADAIGRIVNGLRSENPDVRDAAVDAAVACMSDRLAAQLMGLLLDHSAPERCRAACAIALGPGLEETDLSGGAEWDEPPFSPERFAEIREILHLVYADDSEPKLVRRRALEGSIRTPEPWHAEAIEAAWTSGDKAWRATALMCAGFVDGAEAMVREGFECDDLDLRREAVRAVAMLELKDMGSRVLALAATVAADRNLRWAAIDALPALRPPGTLECLEALSSGSDKQTAAVAEEAMLEFLSTSHEILGDLEL